MMTLPVIKQPIYDSYRSFFPTEEAWIEFLHDGFLQISRENPLLAKFIDEQLDIVDCPDRRKEILLAVLAILGLINHQNNNMGFGQPTIVSGRTPFLS